MAPPDEPSDTSLRPTLSVPASDATDARTELEQLRSALDAARDESSRLLEALSVERRSSLQLQQELEEQVARLQGELQRLKPEQVSGAPDEVAPRHSWVVRKEPGRHTADTVRPPPVTARSASLKKP
jgi:hypothetical protein